MGRETYIFAGGGTGGHIYPGLAVADALTTLHPEAKIVLACSSRAIDRSILSDCPYAVAVQPVRPLPHNPWRVAGFVSGWLRSSKMARTMITDLRPAAVLGLGGFAAGPLVRAAANTSVRCGLLNPDAVPGRANRLLSRYADAIFTQFDATAEAFGPGLQDRIEHVGAPIRSLPVVDRAEAEAFFGLEPARKTLLVLGGSQGAATVNEAFAALRPRLTELAGQWQVLHIAGPAQVVEVGADSDMLLVRHVRYCRRMEMAYAAADLALCRAGASTVAELAVAGTPAVFMPYPYHRDKHQTLNARQMAHSGAAVVCEDARDAAVNARVVWGVLEDILRDPARREAMRQAAASLGRPGGAQAVARWLLDEQGT